MYPLVRLAKELLQHRKLDDLPILGTHVSHHRCWPQDLDIYLEMNNGRILTILDLGRIVLARRVGLVAALRANGWGMAMAGASIRYRKRIRPFVRFRVTSRCVGWDDRFFYLEHQIWIGKECAVHALFRAAITDAAGIVAPGRVFRWSGYQGPRPQIAAWAQHWIDAESTRPWPPEDPAAPASDKAASAA